MCLRFVGSLTLLFVLSQASFGQAPTPAAIEHFEKKVRPLLVEHCGSCHGAEAKKIKGGLKLTTKADLLKGGESGPAVAPGDPDKSLLVKSIRYDGELKMPPKGKLRDGDIAVLTEWVKSGAAWPDSVTPLAPTTTDQKGTLFTAEQKAFWAFQPVKPINPPTVKNAAWVKSPIDAFLLAKLEEKGLIPAAPADKRTLLRRVTFDLTGLPPTPEEIDAFLMDASPTAFAKVVDRLLASPAYGERWARHWLDVARYADSNGLDENTSFGNAWRYRDYVIKALNADKPFDRFVKEQIAGDLLPAKTDEEKRDHLTATGYLVLGPKVLAEPDKQKMLLDIADEQLDTLGKGLLGLTFGCARCHDHKFDPLPHRDYYSLLAVFTSTRTMQNLNTVAKAFETTPSGPESAEVKASRARLDTLRKEAKELEKKFGKTPESDKKARGEIHVEAEKRRTEIKDLEAKIPAPDFVLCVEDGSAAAYGTQPRNLHVQVRGNYVTPGEEAPAVFPRIIAGEQQESFVAVKPNTGMAPEANKTRFGNQREKSGRLELANWIADAKNPLTARVFVNRVWKHHLGEGIVRSPDNFGKLGERPTHPELLDWLAAEFVRNGWSIKQLHRTMLLTNAYQMSSTHDAKATAADPENRLLSRFPRRRLEAEPIRDAILAVSDDLDRTMGGSLLANGNFEYINNEHSKGEVRYGSNRRSVYLPVIRNNVFPFFQTFDFPEPSVMSGDRDSTVIAPQALFLLNSPFVLRQSELFAERLLKSEVKDDARVAIAYRLAYGREATTEEVSRSLGFVATYTSALESGEKDAVKRKTKAWAALAQTIFASSEFVFVN